MSSVLERELEAVLLPGMRIPDEIRDLYAWIEEKGWVITGRNGQHFGVTYPEDELKTQWGDSERPGGTRVIFQAEGNEGLHYWFGHKDPDVLNRVCVFAQTGGEGSRAAFWLRPDGEQQIVHLGSGSGSTMVCVLASSAADFLRLLAIGYDEICWDSALPLPPNQDLQGGLLVHPNRTFQEWVVARTMMPLPNLGTDIVRYVSTMESENTQDPFLKWVRETTP